MAALARQRRLFTIAIAETFRVDYGYSECLWCVMPRLSALAVILVVPWLGSCSTGAQRQAQLIGGGIQAAKAESAACLQPINSDPTFEALTKHMPLEDINRATLLQMTDSTKATNHEVNLLSERHSRIQSCRKIFLEGLAKVAPSLVAVWVEEYAKADQNLVDLARQNVTWGEYIARTKNILAELQTKYVAALQKIQTNLEASHQQELAQRQAAANAMLQYYQNQQLLNAISRPVTTNCNRFGSMVNCTTY